MSMLDTRIVSLPRSQRTAEARRESHNVNTFGDVLYL